MATKKKTAKAPRAAKAPAKKTKASPRRRTKAPKPIPAPAPAVAAGAEPAPALEPEPMLTVVAAPSPPPPPVGRDGLVPLVGDTAAQPSSAWTPPAPAASSGDDAADIAAEAEPATLAGFIATGDKPAAAWDGIKQGWTPRAHPRLGMILVDQSQRARWGAGLEAEVERRVMLRALRPPAYLPSVAPGAAPVADAVTWSTTFPTRPGFYYFFGRRPQDGQMDPPALHVVKATEMIQRHRKQDGSAIDTPYLDVASEGQPMRAPGGAAVGFFAPASVPEVTDAMIMQAAMLRVTPPEGTDPSQLVHCAYGGRVLCGALETVPSVRPEQLASISCPTCRAHAEIHT